MNEYDTIDDAWDDTLADLLIQEPGDSRNGDAREIIGHSFKLTDPSCCWLTNERRALSPYYAAAEILWYVSGNPSVEMISAYASQYKNFAETDGKAYGAYGKRLGSSINAAIHALKYQANTRRCVISLWEQSDLDKGHGEGAVKDVPCTLSWQFIVRGDRLHMIVNMRSNDAWLGLPYDCMWNCTAMRLIANELGLGLGTYTHNVGSMHLYEKHYAAACEAVVAYDSNWDTYSVWAPSCDTFKTLRNYAVPAEFELRNSNKTGIPVELHDIGLTLLALCQSYIMGASERLHQMMDPVLVRAEKLYLSKRGTGEK